MPHRPVARFVVAALLVLLADTAAHGQDGTTAVPRDGTAVARHGEVELPVRDEQEGRRITRRCGRLRMPGPIPKPSLTERVRAYPLPAPRRRCGYGLDVTF